MQQKDYYQILGIDKNADASKAKAAYRKLAFKFHPDKCGDDPEAAQKMKDLNEAYAVLSDEKKRREYDMMRYQYGSSAHTQFRGNYSEQDIFNGSDINQIFEEMAKSFGFRGADDIFGDFYGSNYQTFKFGKSGRGVRFSFSSGFGGKEMGKKQFFKQMLNNPFGQTEGEQIGARQGEDLMETILLSQPLADKGGPYAYQHPHTNKKYIVKIPPNTKEGVKIRLAGMGTPGPGNATPGDIYLVVKIQPDTILKKFKVFLSSLFKSKQ